MAATVTLATLRVSASSPLLCFTERAEEQKIREKEKEKRARGGNIRQHCSKDYWNNQGNKLG